MLRHIRSGDIEIEYNLIQTERKSIECRVMAGEIRVFAPKRLPARTADEFVRERAEWILSASAEMRRRENALAARAAEALRSVPIEGTEYPVECIPGGRKGVRLENGKLLVTGTDGSVEEAGPLVKGFLMNLARTRFAECVARYAPLVGCRPGRIALREQKTKWGSCSSKDNLNFNWKLIMAPPGALEYVVIHELCHMKHFDHSPAFWSLVRKYCPVADRWMLFLKKDFRPPHF